MHEIRFDYDRYAIRSADAKILEENARWLLANPGARLLIEGHCDERGTEEYNLSLGERRARAARDYLAKLGVNGERVVMLSYGKERPACRESSEGCWARNRRARFLVAS